MKRAKFAAALLLWGLSTAAADEGMWLVNQPPLERLRAYGFEPAPGWFEELMKACVRVSTGGSGSIVSRDGLVMTNHHVGSDVIAKLSTPERDLMRDGFLARTRGEELRCPDLELHALREIRDVTERVEAAARGLGAAEAGAARRREIAAIESEAAGKSGLMCEVVTLYQGARFHLYCYERYTDVRLVFAPEIAIANFGGDTDNFEYPRFCLDVCFFRIYENGRPLRAEHHLGWSAEGSEQNQLVMVLGHPGRTQRLNTLEHLKFIRDFEEPWRLHAIWRREVQLQTFSARGAERRRQAQEELLVFANSRKARTGQLAALMEPALIERKAAAQAALRGEPRKGDAWNEVEAALEDYREVFLRHESLGRWFRSELFAMARDLVRLADELPKPSGDRLREYRDSNLERVYFGLLSDAPIHAELEMERIESALANLVERFGGDDPVTLAALAGKSPRARAREVVSGTTLFSTRSRAELKEGGKAAVEASRDPMIELARAIDPEARKVRDFYESRVEARLSRAYAGIAAAKFAAEGESTYPDATFTLRLSYGMVDSYYEDDDLMPTFTTVGGLFERAEARGGEPEFTLPASWLAARGKLDMETPMNFVCTPDIIGGNSGSPVFDTDGRVVGLIFDGNTHTLAWAYEYDDERARAIAVDSRVIVEALRKVYNAEFLARELLDGAAPAKVEK